MSVNMQSSQNTALKKAVANNKLESLPINEKLLAELKGTTEGKTAEIEQLLKKFVC